MAYLGGVTSSGFGIFFGNISSLSCEFGGVVQEVRFQKGQTKSNEGVKFFGVPQPIEPSPSDCPSVKVLKDKGSAGSPYKVCKISCSF